jgi:DNA-binding NarL/FixJ family response regulator
MRMRQPDLVSAPEVSTLRACANCGRNFSAPGKEYTCPTCLSNIIPTKRRLSMRESQIVHLVQQAKTNKEIAAELQLSPGTAKQYLHNLFRKLGLRNRTELAIWGREYTEAWSRAVAAGPSSHVAQSSS